MTESTLVPQRRPIWRRIVKWSLGVVITLVAIVALIWGIWSYLASRAINRQVAQIQAAGEPLNFRQLAAKLPKIDPARDAGRFYAAGIALVREDQADANLADDLTAPEGLAAARRLVELNKLALDMLDRGTAMPQCGYDLGIELGIAASLPRISDLRSLASMASLRTRLLAMEAQGDAAVESAISTLQLLRAYDRQPILIVHLSRLGVASSVARDTVVILESGVASPAALERLEAAFRDVEASIDMKQVWMAERVYALEIMRNLVAGPRQVEDDIAPGPALPEQWPGGIGSPPLRSLAARMIAVNSRFLSIASLPWPQALREGRRIRTDGSSDLFDMASIAPAAERAVVSTAYGVATLRATRLAIAAELHRREKGSLPQSLAELHRPQPDETAVDPFTGQPLIYRAAPDGFVIYSTGEDGRDDGGQNLKRRDEGDWGLGVRLQPATRPSR